MEKFEDSEHSPNENHFHISNIAIQPLPLPNLAS